MKTYGHLRREHSIAQAQRVTFAPAPDKQADMIAFPANSLTQNERPKVTLKFANFFFGAMMSISDNQYSSRTTGADAIACCA